MEWAGIHKVVRTSELRPVLFDYEQVARDFSWAQAATVLSGLPGRRGLNIAYEAVDRHVDRGRGGHAALRWVGRHGEAAELTYAELSVASSRFDNVLRELGVGPQERVFTLLGRIPRR